MTCLQWPGFGTSLAHCRNKVRAAHREDDAVGRIRKSKSRSPRRKLMKKLAALLSLVLLAGVMQATASGLITKSQAEQDALNAVGGGTVDQAYREKEIGKLIWSV